ncbi:MAG: DNA/RNA nuclease SfsA [Bacillota bacterium]
MTARRDPGSPLSIRLSDLTPATVVARPNRFVAEVTLGGTGPVVSAHVADSGRLKELIFPGNQVMVRQAVSASGEGQGEQQGKAQRKTHYDLVLASAVEGGDDSPKAAASNDGPAQAGNEGPAQAGSEGPAHAGSAFKKRRIWVSVDTRYPNMLLGQALRAGALKEFDATCTVAHEYWYHHLSPWKEEDAARRDGLDERQHTAHRVDGGEDQRVESGAVKAPARPVRSRMDFYLDGGSREGSCLIEVKSVTLCRAGVGLFPDAPTDRGARHLRELARAVEEGYRAYVVFIAQREDIRIVKPNRETDPAFADALEQAEKAGVRLLGYTCRVTPEEITLDPTAIPVST